MKNLMSLLVWQFVLLVLLGFLYEIIVALYILSLASHQLFLAVVFSTLTPFFSLAAQHWFVEAPTLSRRIILTMATAVGYGIGTWVSLWMFGA
ncbi:hypothetical protein C4577_03720 [Candidatus Parcubacteria bacterium]|nr:MAG: hypothetical protein C4577_03720 [Candidatus Parcubacteria bacterium]